MSFWSEVTRNGMASCWLVPVLKARSVPTEDPSGPFMPVPSGLLECDRIMDAHHVVPKQVLRREYRYGPLTWEGTVDARNGVPVCRRHHDLLERHLVRLTRAELPPAVEEFAAEIGVGWWLDRTFGPAEAAA